MPNYYLLPYKLAAQENAFVGRIEYVERIPEDRLIEDMVSMGTTFSRADINGCLELFSIALTKRLRDGYSVRTRFGIYRPVMNGVFDGMDDHFDKSRHSLDVKVIKPQSLVDHVRATATVSKVHRSRYAPRPLQLVDIATNSINQFLTPGNIATLSGARLKFNQDSAEEGVFFRAADNSVTRVEFVSMNNARKLIFLIPPTLTPGLYKLEMRITGPQNIPAQTTMACDFTVS